MKLKKTIDQESFRPKYPDLFPNSVEAWGPSLGKGAKAYEMCTKLYTDKTIDMIRTKYG